MWTRLSIKYFPKNWDLHLILLDAICKLDASICIAYMKTLKICIMIWMKLMFPQNTMNSVFRKVAIHTCCAQTNIWVRFKISQHVYFNVWSNYPWMEFIFGLSCNLISCTRPIQCVYCLHYHSIHYYCSLSVFGFF